MPPRGRYVAFGSDDDESEYITLPLPSVEGRSSSRLRVVVDEDRRPSPSRRAERQKVYHAHSYQAAPQTAVEPDGIFVEGLHVPQSRPRASSTGARPHPNYLPRERSRTRVKHYHHDHYDYSDESSDDTVCKPSRRRHKRDSSFNGGRLSPDTLKKLAKLELLERQQSTDPAVAAQLAKLQAMEEKRTREDEEAKLIARMEDRERREKQKEEQLLREYREKQRQKDAEEKAFYAEAEAKRLKREVEAKAESDRLIALQKEKDAKAKADRLRIIAEEKARIKKEEEEAEEERKRIVLEEKAKEEKEKLKREALKKQILAEEEQKKKEEKEKKQKEEEEFQQKVKERFMKAGYSPDYVEDILREKQLTRHSSTSRRAQNQLAIEAGRPTYIRVQVRHLFPQTLEAYNLPWEYDPSDDRYILIKDYISHEFQQELFEHTKKIKIRQEKLLITDGYTKDTVTTLKPRKKTDDILLVRRKSDSKSKSPARRSWMFS